MKVHIWIDSYYPFWGIERTKQNENVSKTKITYEQWLKYQRITREFEAMQKWLEKLQEKQNENEVR